MFGLWDMIVAVVFLGTIGGMYGAYAKSRAVRSQDKYDDEVLSDLDGFDGRIRKLESRLGNIETIVLEQEKQQKFDNQL